MKSGHATSRCETAQIWKVGLEFRGEFRAILNLRPTFPSGGIDITDMISEFENEAFVGFQEIFFVEVL